MTNTAVHAGPTAGVVMQDGSGRITVASEVAARLLGAAAPPALQGQLGIFQPGTLIRLDGSQLPPDQEPAALAFTTGQRQAPVVLGWRRPDGQTRWFSVEAEALFPIGSQQPYAVVSRFEPCGAEPDESAAAPRCTWSSLPGQHRGR